MFRSSLLTSVVFLAVCLSVQGQGERRFVPAVVAFYNLENLFDTIDQPDVQDEEFLPGGPYQWTSARYHRKLQHMAKVISEIGTDVNPAGVAVLGVSEVENGGVVEDLVRTPPLEQRGYKVVSHEGPDARGVDVGVIYDPAQFTLLGYKAYRLRMAEDTAFKTRDQLLVTGLLDGDTVHIIVNHWPSRRGGEKRSQPKRWAAADLGRHIIDSLLARNPDARILHMGDLNDDPIDASLVKHLKVVGDKQHVNGTLMYDPMIELYKKGIGSLAWQDSWNLFDQISLSPALVTGNGGRYKYFGVRIFNQPYLRQKEGNFAGYPLRTFVGTNYTDGYSDHFPGVRDTGERA
jgi:hypothetical protein